jgi:colicin import membrane protein
MTATISAPTTPKSTIPNDESLLAPVTETTALTRWESLAANIAMASQDAEGRVYNYRDKHDNKAARSWVAQLRRLKGGIERARKDAKAVHLERGRAIDEAAKTLESAVVGLIEPHETAIKLIEAEEQARVDAHKAMLDRIAQQAQGVTTAAEAEARLAELETINPSEMEEFAEAGTNRLCDAIEQLEALRDALQIQEAERAELEALRAEKARRHEAEQLERIRQEAIEQERQRAAAEAIEQEARIRQEAEERQRASDEQARIEREAAAAREYQALVAAEAALRAQEEAEQRAAEAEQREQERLAEQARAEQARADAEARAQQARKALSKALQRELTAEMDGMTPASVAAAIADGTLHPAIQVDWTQVR